MDVLNETRGHVLFYCDRISIKKELQVKGTYQKTVAASHNTLCSCSFVSVILMVVWNELGVKLCVFEKARNFGQVFMGLYSLGFWNVSWNVEMGESDDCIENTISKDYQYNYHGSNIFDVLDSRFFFTLSRNSYLHIF